MASGRALVFGLCTLWIVSGCAGTSAPPSSAPSVQPTEPAASATASAPPSAAVVEPCTAPAGESTSVSWTVDGEERLALVHPSASAATSPAPLVIALHGYGGFGMELERLSELSDAADERGWFVVYPEGIGTPQAWSYDRAQLEHAADIAFLREVIGDLVEAGCADATRVVVTGISQGGWLADMAGCELSDLVTGVVSVASNDFGWPCEPDRPVAFAAISGVEDDLLPYEGGPVNAPPPVTSVGSVDDWLADRASSRACAGDSEESRLFPHVVLQTWSSCSAPVSLYRVEDGGHSWPSGGGFQPVNHELSVTEVIAGMLDAPS